MFVFLVVFVFVILVNRRPSLFGFEISDIDEIEIGGGFDDESRIEYCEHIYAMLIAPFAVWLAKTGYKPDDAFFKKTLL